jgi:acyl-coenzyme A thioesterase 13
MTQISYQDRLTLLQTMIGKEFTNSPSPYMRWLKATIIEAERGHTVVEIFIREEMTNPLGMIHGGVIASIHDEITGLTNACLGQMGAFVTTDLHTRFFRPAKNGEVIRAVGKIVRAGKSVVFAESEIFNSNGDLLSSGSATLYQPITKPL